MDGPEYSGLWLRIWLHTVFVFLWLNYDDELYDPAEKSTTHKLKHKLSERGLCVYIQQKKSATIKYIWGSNMSANISFGLQVPILSIARLTMSDRMECGTKKRPSAASRDKWWRLLWLLVGFVWQHRACVDQGESQVCSGILSRRTKSSCVSSVDHFCIMTVFFHELSARMEQMVRHMDITIL